MLLLLALVAACSDRAPGAESADCGTIMLGDREVTEDTEQAAGLGSAVALEDFNGDGTGEVAAGAPLAEGASSSDVGSVLTWQPPATTPQPLAAGETAGGRFGSALAVAADLNADGLPDLITGAPGADQVVVLLSPFDAGEQSVLFGRSVGDRFGAAVSGGVDVQIVGAPLADGGASAAGAAYVTVPSVGETFVLSGEPDQDGEAGIAVLVADVDADGIDDFIVGADHVGNPGALSGAIYAVFGPVRQDSSLVDADIVLRGRTGAYSGFSLAGLDDDQDGRTDLFVGSLGFGGTVVVVTTLSAGTWDLESAAAASLVGDERSVVFGAAIAVAQGPGAADLLLVGDPLAEDGFDQLGVVWLFEGPISRGGGGAAIATIHGEDSLGQFGFSVGLWPRVGSSDAMAAVGAPGTGGGRIETFAITCAD